MKTLKIRGIQGKGYEGMTDTHPIMPLRLLSCGDDYTWFSTIGPNSRSLGIPALYFAWAPSVDWQEIPYDEIAKKQS